MASLFWYPQSIKRKTSSWLAAGTDLNDCGDSSCIVTGPSLTNWIFQQSENYKSKWSQGKGTNLELSLIVKIAFGHIIVICLFTLYKSENRTKNGVWRSFRFSKHKNQFVKLCRADIIKRQSSLTKVIFWSLKLFLIYFKSLNFISKSNIGH